MSCLGDDVLRAYTADALASLERRDAEVHLVRCRDCRARVVALRERAAAPGGSDAGAAPPAAPEERGFAPGFAIALALVVLGLAAFGQASGGSLLRLTGVYGMGFDLLFWARTRAPGLIELLAALAALASVAAIAALAVASITRRVGPRLVVALAVGGALAGPARALEARSGEAVLVAPGETIEGSLAASADVVRIEGAVEGDLFVSGDEVEIAGRVAGNVFAWARALRVSGVIGGSLHAACERLALDGEVRGSTYTATETLALGETGRVAGDAVAFGETVVLAGSVGRDAIFTGDTLELRGRVEHDVRVLRAERMRVLSGASVGRDVHASLARASALEVAPDAHIGGARDISERGAGESVFAIGRWLWPLVQVAAALAFGVALYALVPGLFRTRVPTVASFLRHLGIGTLAVIAAPVLLALVAITLVGLPLAVLGVFLYLTALYLAHVLAAAALGRALLRRGMGELPGLVTFARTLLVGLLAAALASELPGVGMAVHIVLVLVGLGLVAERAQALRGTPRPA